MANQRTPSTHTCAIKTCTKTIRTDQLMCKDHWFMLPADMRQRVTSTYANWLRLIQRTHQHKAQADTMVRAGKTYREARDSAVALVEQMLVDAHAQDQKE